MKSDTKELDRLRASIAAIYWYSNPSSIESWKLVPKSSLAETLNIIREECEDAIPELKKIDEDYKIQHQYFKKYHKK